MKTEQTIFNKGKPVDLLAMLDAREQRAHIEQVLLDKLETEGSLFVMTMAIPGPIKSNTKLDQAFDELLNEVTEVLNHDQIIQTLKREEETGLEYYALSKTSPREMKTILVQIEEEHPLGRLFDLDVVFLDEDGNLQGTSRTELGLPVRRCFICDRPAKDCGRSRRHSVAELQNEISKRILDYFKEE